MAGNPEDSDADDATRISRRFPRVPAQGSIDNARGVARPLPNGAGKRRWAGGEPGRRVHGWLGGCRWSAYWRAGFVGGGDLISEPHRVSVRTPRLRMLTQYP